MRVFCRRILIVIASVIVSFYSCGAANAFNGDVESFLKYSAVNEMQFYYPFKCDDNEGGKKTCIVPTGDQITWIGDSYSVGAKSIIEQSFSRISFGGSVDDANSQIQVSKTVSGGSASNPSGFTILQKIINEGNLKPYLVFALGTNDGWDNDKVNSFNSMMSGHSNTKVVFVSSKTPKNDYASSNATLAAMVEANSNYSLADWAEVEKDEWFEGDSEKIHPVSGDGYKTWVNTIKDALPKNCSGALCGANAREKYWSALSNHFGPAAAAGIMGNIDNEGGYSPTLMEQTYLKAYDLSTKTWVNGWSWDSYYNSDDRPTGIGAFQITSGRSSYLHYINDTDPGLLKYFEDPGTYSTGDGDKLTELIGEEDFDKLVEIEIEWMYKTLENHYDFDLNAFKNMGDYREAAKYFLIKYERPADQGEREQQERADAAQRVYNDFKDFKCSQGVTNTEYSSTENVSASGNIGYDATDDEIDKILKFAVWINQKTNENYRMVISKILDDYEAHGQGGRGKTAELIKYIESGQGFIYRDKYDEYTEDKTKIKVDAGQLEGAKATIIDGVRATTSGKLLISNGRQQGADFCPDNTKKAGNGRIAEIAALMSWPVQSWQTEADDYSAERAGRCNGGNGWTEYIYDMEPCSSNPRDFYKNNVKPGLYGWLDCGVFALGVLRYLDLVDDNAVSGGQPGAGKYFRSHSDEWQAVDASSESDLKPGDVIWNNGHIIIYVGEKYGGEYGTLAHASAQTRVGEIGSFYLDLSDWDVFRYVGDKLGGGVDEDGLSYEDAKKLMMNYGEDINGVVSRTIPDRKGTNCYGGWLSNCVAFSAFYMAKFTSMNYGGGNGSQVIDKVTGDFTRGSEPRVWAVYSTGVADEHTGVILGKEGDEWIVGQAGCLNSGTGRGNGTPEGGGAGVVIKSSNLPAAAWGTPRGFVYPNEVDYDAIMNFINAGE
ncbi:hypothetical protein IKG38_01505 [Candidatus Saccharibacteria bacterium]|nr:hypothetical protein [Candidatus Saccharibacteria bacterium]